MMLGWRRLSLLRLLVVWVVAPHYSDLTENGGLGLTSSKRAESAAAASAFVHHEHHHRPNPSFGRRHRYHQRQRPCHALPILCKLLPKSQVANDNKYTSDNCRNSGHLQCYHQVNGIECVEVVIPSLPCGVGSVTILEATAAAQNQLVNVALGEEEVGVQTCRVSLPTGDPYGAVLWPAASVVAHALLPLLHDNSTVLELGAGTGLVSLAAYKRGIRRILATDYEQLPLDLLQYAARNLPDNQPPPTSSTSSSSTKAPFLECLLLDMCDLKGQPLPLSLAEDDGVHHHCPTVDFVVAADVMYEPVTGQAVAHRVVEALRQGATVLVGDSPGRAGRPAFLKTLRSLLLFGGRACDNSTTATSKLDFVNVTGWTVQGPRHSLICGAESTTISARPRELTVALMVLRPQDYGFPQL